LFENGEASASPNESRCMAWTSGNIRAGD
jgi:hypothetical protein